MFSSSGAFDGEEDEDERGVRHGRIDMSCHLVEKSRLRESDGPVDDTDVGV